MSAPGGRPASGADDSTGGTTERRPPVPSAAAGAPAERASLRGAAVDVLCVALLGAGAAAGFFTVFTGPPVIVAVAVAIVAALGVAVAGTVARWSMFTVVAVAAVVVFLIGPAATAQDSVVAGFVPTPAAWTGLVRSLIAGWKRLLTIVPPVGDEAGLLVVPFVTVFVGVLCAAALVLRARWRAWSLLPLAAVLAVGIAFGGGDPAAPAAAGAVIAVVAVLWIAVRGTGGPAAIRTRRRPARLVAAAAMLAVAGAAGAAAASAVVGVQDRALLRDHVVPPMDMRQYVSPLTSFRNFVKQYRNTELFSVTGLPSGERLRLAVLDAYDGRIYGVDDQRGTDGGSFQRTARAERIDATLPTGAAADVTVDVGAYTGVWMPSVAHVDGIDVTGPRAETVTKGMFTNPASGTTVTTAGLQPGDRYTVTGRFPVHPSDQRIGDDPAARLTLPAPRAVPGSVASLAEEWSAGEATPIARVRAVEQKLHTTGFYSNGQDGEARSRAGHGADRIDVLLQGGQMIGDAEQYAVAMALMVRSIGMPARVVVGFIPPADRSGDGALAVTGDMASAWVEVPFEGIGWVAFDPTPDRDRVPQQVAPRPKTAPEPKSVQPPPPPQGDVELLTASSADEGRTADDGLRWLWALLADMGVMVGRAMLIIVLALLPVGAIVIAKARRTRRRRAMADPRRKVAAGWQELVDVMLDLGVAHTPGGTRREAAEELSARYPHLSVLPMAAGADAGVFAPGELAQAQADAYWREVDQARSQLRHEAGPMRWWRSRIMVRSLAGERFGGQARAAWARLRAAVSRALGRVRGEGPRTWTR